MGAKPCEKCTALEEEKNPKVPMLGSCYFCKQKFRGWGSRCPDCQSHDLECPRSPKPCDKCTALEKEKDPKVPMCGSCYICKQKFRGSGSRCPDCQSHDLECPRRTLRKPNCAATI